MKILKFGICSGVAIIAGYASVWNADDGVSSYIGFIKTPLEFGAYVPAILLLIAIISAWQMISAFFAKPAEKKDIERIEEVVKVEARSLSEDVTEARTITQGEHAKTRLQSASQFENLQAQLDRMESKLGPEERKSFEDAVRDILNSDDAREFETQNAVKEGRYSDAADNLMKAGRQKEAAEKDFGESALKDYRRAGTFYMLTDTTRAIEAFEHAVAKKDDDPWTYIYLSRLYRKQGDTQKSRQILETVGPHEKYAQMVIEIELGDIETAQGNLTKAKANYEKGLKIAKTLTDMDPKNADYKRGLSVSYERLGDIETAQGNLTKAKANYEKGLKIAKTLTGYKRNLSVSYERLGDIETAQGNLANAKANYEKGLKIRETLTEMDPKNADYKRDLAVSYDKMAPIDMPNAKTHWMTAHKIMKALSDAGQMRPADQDWFNALEAKVRDD